MATAPRAPWFFRQRFVLFGLVYGLSFALGFLVAGLLQVAPQPLFLSSQYPYVFAGLAAVCAFGGYALRVWASSYLAASIVWTGDVQLEELRVSGPYRFTRNPLYLGNLLQAVGIGMLGPWPVTLLLICLMCAYQIVLVSVEERFLAQKNGSAYLTYLATVPRFVPLLGRVARAGGQQGSLRDGLRSEIMSAGFAVGVILLVALYLPRVGGSR